MPKFISFFMGKQANPLEIPQEKLELEEG